MSDSKRGLCPSCLQIPYGNGMTLGQALERNPMISDYEISATIMGKACSSCWANIQNRTSLGY